MHAWLDILIVTAIITAALAYLLRGFFARRRTGKSGCGNKSCGDACRLTLGKDD